MVKKLLKHEAIYYSRTLILFEAVLFGLAIFTRLLLFFETDTIIYYLIQGSSYVLFGFAAAACVLMTTVISVYRFYKNLFTNEGYLSFTLPVSTNQHLFAKLFSAITYSLITYFSIFVAFLITISGDILNEICKAGLFLLEKIFNNLDSAAITHIIFYVIEYVALIFTTLIFNYLLYYVCITIGQTAKKNRILFAVLCYFAYGMISEVISTFVSIAISVIDIPFDVISKFFEEYTYQGIHIMLVTSLVINIVMIIAFYIINHVIISKKLNLE